VSTLSLFNQLKYLENDNDTFTQKLPSLVHLNRFIRPQLVSARLAGGPHHNRKCRRCCHPQRHRNRSQTAGNVYRKRITGKLNQYNCNSIIVALIIELKAASQALHVTGSQAQPCSTHTYIHKYHVYVYVFLYDYPFTWCNETRAPFFPPVSDGRPHLGLPFSSKCVFPIFRTIPQRAFKDILKHIQTR